ncbi:MAG: hypothetical protein ACJ749_09700 [Flavisolibacter sp.]
MIDSYALVKQNISETVEGNDESEIDGEHELHIHEEVIIQQSVIEESIVEESIIEESVI